MLNYKPSSSNTEDFAIIEKPGVYKAKLAIVRTNLQDSKYVEEDKEPKQQVSFVWDCIDKAGHNVHVHTKPCTLSWGDKAKMPKLWESVAKLTNMEDFTKLLYDKDGNLKDMCADVMVKVTDKDGKVYNEVTDIIELTETNEVKPSELFDWDLKVYGKPCEEYELTPAYDKGK